MKFLTIIQLVDQGLPELTPPQTPTVHQPKARAQALTLSPQLQAAIHQRIRQRQSAAAALVQHGTTSGAQGRPGSSSWESYY